MHVRLFSESGRCGACNHDARFVLVRDGKEEILCPEHLQQKLLGVHCPSLAAQFRGDARPPVAGLLQRNALNGVAQFHVAIRAGLTIRIEAIEAGPAHPA